MFKYLSNFDGSLASSHSTLRRKPAAQFLESLWSSHRAVHQVGLLDKAKGKFQNLPVKSIAEALPLAAEYSERGYDTYFSPSSFANPDNRKATNVIGASSFWLDIDVGLEKAAAGKGYESVAEAKCALASFCDSASFPAPTFVVHSGGGIQVYWALTTPVARELWQIIAKKLKALTKALGLRADPSRTTDIASVMRFPGTLNFKYQPPRPVDLVHSSDPIDTNTFLTVVKAAFEEHSAVLPLPASHMASFVNANIDAKDRAHYSSCVPLNLVALESALTILDPDCDEPTWTLRRIAPLARAAKEYPDLADAIRDLAVRWSSGDLAGVPSRAWCTPGGNGLTGFEYFGKQWARFVVDDYSGRCITIATIFRDARLAGWTDPTETFESVEENGAGGGL